MHPIINFALAVRKHWGALVTGGALIGLLGIWQGTGHSVPAWVYSAIALIALFAAFYKAWKEKAEQVETEIAKAREVDRKRIALVGSDEWLDLSDRFKEISKFAGVQLHTASRDGSEVHTWRFDGERGETKSCMALCARAGAMLLKSPRLSVTLSDRVRRTPDNAERWLCFLQDDGAVRYDHGPGREEYDGGVTLHFLGYLAEVGPVSARSCIECSAKEL